MLISSVNFFLTYKLFLLLQFLFMLRPFKLSFLFLLLFSFQTQAQLTSWFTLNQNYKTGIELLDKKKYAAASEQFSRVGNLQILPSSIQQYGKDISLLKENAEYYRALCALELGNQDAESLFLKFIADYPVNANTKMAFYLVGRSYFSQKNYPKAIEWFKKIDQNSLSGKESAEYRFKLGYAYFETKNYSGAEPLFGKLKDENTT